MQLVFETMGIKLSAVSQWVNWLTHWKFVAIWVSNLKHNIVINSQSFSREDFRDEIGTILSFARVREFVWESRMSNFGRNFGMSNFAGIFPNFQNLAEFAEFSSDSVSHQIWWKNTNFRRFSANFHEFSSFFALRELREMLFSLEFQIVRGLTN